MLSVLDKKTSSSLIEGHYVHKRIDATTIQSCHMKIDEDGMFLIWTYPIKKEIESLELTHIREVRIGHSIKDNKGSSQLADLEVYSDKLISIMYGFEISNLSLVQFIASSVDVAVLWTKGLNQLLYNTSSRHLCFQQVLKKQWKRLCYSTNSKGLIPIRRIVKMFGHDKCEKVFFQKVKKAGFNLQKNDELDPEELTFDRFKSMYEVTCTRNELSAIFTKICKPNCRWVELNDLMTWLNENQRDPRSNEILVPFFDVKRTSAIINQHEPDAGLRDKNCFSAEGFENYLQSGDNPLVYSDHVRTNMDMTQPMSHYFINSSHNTYLTGSQFGGKSSVDVYRHVLLSGCRCIELDCWDGKGDMSGEPIITHGKAMCTDVSFRDVLMAIRETAFIASQFPIILSFETHCTKPMQHKMAAYCEEIFGDLLLGNSLDAFPLEPGAPLPSPSHLMRKIIIKNKRLPREQPNKCAPEIAETLDDVAGANGDGIAEEDANTKPEAHPELDEKVNNDEDSTTATSLLQAEGTAEKNTAGPRPTRAPSSAVVTTKSTAAAAAGGNNEVETTAATGTKVTKPPAGPQADDIDKQELMRNYVYVKTSYTNIHPSLSGLVNYCQSVKFSGFKKLCEEKVEARKSFHMSSFNETVGLNHLKNNAIEFVDYNKTQMSRIYPRGSRVDSSNYTPQPFWDAGCQMVSLNFQTCDLGMQVSTGKFEYNGNCGYLLKPAIMTADNRVFDPFAEVTVDGVIAASCRVKVISGLFLGEKPQTTYVEVDMYGLPNDTIRKEFRTAMVVNNSLNPSYTNNEFRFRKVICPDLALLRFAVLDDSRQIVGQRVIPFSSLQAGYHYIGLRSASSVPLDTATIFVKITLGSYVPDNLQVVVEALENPCAHQKSLRKQREKLLNKMMDDLVEAEEDDDDVDGADDGDLSNNNNISNHVSSRHNSTKPGDNNGQRGSFQSGNNKKMNASTKSGRTSGRQRSQGGGEGSVAGSVKDNPQQNNNYQLKSSDSISMLYNKDIAEDLLERSVSKHISLEELRLHRAYISALHGKKKSSRRRPQKQGIETISSAEQARNTCCWPGSLVFCKRRRSNISTPKEETRLTDSKSSSSLSKIDCDNSAVDNLKWNAFTTALASIHEEMRRELVKIHEKETNELTRNQTKVWIKRKKEVSKDPKIPSAERERRIRELQGQEVKKFMEERQLLKTRQAKQLSRLEACQKTQATELGEKIKTAKLSV